MPAASSASTPLAVAAAPTASAVHVPARTRRPLPELTVRGRAFAAAGVTILVCSVVLGEGTLLRIGILVEALPWLAALLLVLRRPAAEAARQVAQPVVAAGSPCEVTLHVVRTTRATGALLVEEQLPYALGARPRFLLEGRTREQRLGYTVRSDVRGRYALGPLTTRFTDPFGLAEVRRTSPGTASLVVTPRVLPLPAIDLGGGRAGSGEHRLPLAAAGSAEDATVREYRRGDDLRRVHWRSSARVGELMVRREEHPWEARATVLLDNRASAHAGHGPRSTLEVAVTAAASVAVHLDGQGYAVRLVTADGHATAGGETVAAVLEWLALVDLTRRASLDVSWLADPGQGGTVVGIFGAKAADDPAALRRIGRAAGAAAALVLDVDQWRRSSGRSEDAAATFRALGWRAASLGRTDPLEATWRQLGHAREVRR